MNFKKLPFLLLALLLILQFVPTKFITAQTPTFDEYKSALGNIQVFYDTGSGDLSLMSSGTGFFISEEIMVTAAHVILYGATTDSASPYISVSIPDDTYADEAIGALANVIAIDTNRDIALLHVFPMPFDRTDLQAKFWQHHSFELNNVAPKVGDKISIVGFPDLAEDITITSGLISGKQTEGSVNYYTSDVVASFGNSGGPALNTDNQPVGIVTQIAVSNQNNAQLTKIVPLSDIVSWITGFLTQTQNYKVATGFYKRLEEINKSINFPTNTARAITVNSNYYPTIKFTLPAGYRSFRGLPTSTYYVQNSDQHNVLSIVQRAVPLYLDNSNMVTFLEHYYDLDISNYESASFAGLNGIKYQEGSNTVYAGMDKNYLTMIVVDNNDTQVFKSLNFPSVAFTSNLEKMFTKVNDNFLALQFEAPTGFFAHGPVIITPSNATYGYRVFSSDIISNPIDVEILDGITNREQFIATIEQSLGIHSGQDLGEYISEYSPNKTINGNSVWYTEYTDSDMQKVALALVWDAPRNRMISVYSATTGLVDEVNKILNTISFKETKSYSLTDTISLFVPKPASSNSAPVTTIPVPAENDTETVPNNSNSTRIDLLGMILLQVELHGEAWYIEPLSGKRIYMKNGQAAFDVMRQYGLGITNADLNKIVIGKDRAESSKCSGLGLQLKGRVLLQVDENGEAWYIYPKNCRRYSLGRPDDAYEIMRFLGLGALDKDIEAIKQ